MLTLATVKVPDAKEHDIDVDIDDNGWAYIKQGDDWIAFPVKYTAQTQKKRGRPAPDRGFESCPGCHRLPRYKGGVLQPCACGGPGNPRWPKTI